MSEANQTPRMANGNGHQMNIMVHPIVVVPIPPENASQIGHIAPIVTNTSPMMIAQSLSGAISVDINTTANPRPALEATVIRAGSSPRVLK